MKTDSRRFAACSIAVALLVMATLPLAAQREPSAVFAAAGFSAVNKKGVGPVLPADLQAAGLGTSLAGKPLLVFVYPGSGKAAADALAQLDAAGIPGVGFLALATSAKPGTEQASSYRAVVVAPNPAALVQKLGKPKGPAWFVADADGTVVSVKIGAIDQKKVKYGELALAVKNAYPAKAVPPEAPGAPASPSAAAPASPSSPGAASPAGATSSGAAASGPAQPAGATPPTAPGAPGTSSPAGAVSPGVAATPAGPTAPTVAAPTAPTVPAPAAPAAPKDNTRLGVKPNAGVADLEFMSQVEIEVVAELNLARTDPQGYVAYLKEYRSFINNGIYQKPGEIGIRLSEGTKAVDEAIKALSAQKPLPPFAASKGMWQACRDHVKDQGPKGAVGHDGSDRSSPFDRMNRYGSWQSTAGENISYGGKTARDIVIQLIVDDGVASRGHRKNIYNAQFLVVGAAVGPHKVYGAMCAMDFAGGYAEK